MDSPTQVMDGGMPNEPTQMQSSSEKMGSEPPTRLTSSVKLHVLGPTHIAHEAACASSAGVHF
jgi:hypothetical protein